MSIEESKKRWADIEDDDDIKSGHASRQVLGPDENGIKTIIEFYTDDSGNQVKSVRKIKVTKQVLKTNKRVLERRAWAKFGECAGVGEGPEANVTFTGNEDINLNFSEQKKQEEVKKDLTAVKRSIVTCKNCGEEGHFTARCPHKPRSAPDSAVAAEPAVPRRLQEKEDSSKPAAGGKYVIPKKRDGGSKMQDRDEGYTLRVTNLSEDAIDRDLRELFSRFGMPTRVTKKRGYGFVTFSTKDEAEAAIAGLDGHGYDNLILHVDFARPRE